MAAATGAGRGSFAAARPTDHCAVGWLRQFRNPFNAHTNAHCVTPHFGTIGLTKRWAARGPSVPSTVRVPIRKPPGVNNAYLAAKSPWLQRQFRTPLGLGDLPFIVGRGHVAGEGLPPLQPDLKLDDTVPFRLSRNHLMIEKRDGNYYVRDLCSTLGTIVNIEPIGDHFRGDDAPLRAGENEVIAGGVDSPFVFSVFIA